MMHFGFWRAFTFVSALLTVATHVLAKQCPIWVDVAVDADALDAALLREAIGSELNCAVVDNRAFAHSGEIIVKALGSGQVSVVFLPAKRSAPLRRVVTLPRKAENRVQLIAWLVGNMARDEAADWLLDHQRQKTAKSDGQNDTSVAAAAPPNGDEKSVDSPKTDPAIIEQRDGSAGNAANKKDDENSQRAAPQTAHAAEKRDISPATFDEHTLHRHALNLAVWHGLLEFYPDAAESRFGFHLGIGYGRVGAVRGFAFDALQHRDDFYLHGVAGSFIWTRASNTDGVAFSFGAVTAQGDLHGADLASFVTYRNGATNGLQLAGLATVSKGDVVGGQSATLFNASGGLRGLQLASGANVADDITGLQGSLVNVAKNVVGLQLGLVNVAKKVDGVQIGLVNIADNVRTQAELWTERNYLENVGVRYVYSPLMFAISTGYDAANDRLRFLFGFGARFACRRVAFAPSLDIGAVVDKVRTHAIGQGHDNDVRLSFEWELVPKLLGVVAGPTLAFRSDGTTQLKPLPRWFAGVSLF